MIENTDRAKNLYHASLPTKYSTVMSEAGRQRGGGEGYVPLGFVPALTARPPLRFLAPTLQLVLIRDLHDRV